MYVKTCIFHYNISYYSVCDEGSPVIVLGMATAIPRPPIVDATPPADAGIQHTSTFILEFPLTIQESTNPISNHFRDWMHEP